MIKKIGIRTFSLLTLILIASIALVFVVNFKDKVTAIIGFFLFFAFLNLLVGKIIVLKNDKIFFYSLIRKKEFVISEIKLFKITTQSFKGSLDRITIVLNNEEEYITNTKMIHSEYKSLLKLLTQLGVNVEYIEW